MTRRSPWLVAGFVALLFTIAPAMAAPLTENETIKLAPGHTVRVLSISRIESSRGVALLVRYETNLSIDERKALSDEVDDVWKFAVKDVERCGCTEAVISSNEVPKGIILTTNRMQNFVYEKGADGKWTCPGRSEFIAAQ